MFSYVCDCCIHTFTHSCIHENHFPSAFKELKGTFGNLLGILGTKVDEGLLNVLLQFYDPMYHCFTFRDYQLVPTLEEYEYHVGLSVNDKTPFNGFETELSPYDIAKALCLDTLDVKENLVKNDGRKGVWAKYLFREAFRFVEKKNSRAVETIFTLLMYGLVLFPDKRNFVDCETIQIFLIGNPVPTLLANAYYGIHHKVLKGKGVAVCCAQLLQIWYVSHLPRSLAIEQNLDSLSWSKRIMFVTTEDVKWYNDFYHGKLMINNCGDFPNVPLNGTRGGITYNPTLARHPFGLPMAKAPDNIRLEAHFYTNGKESLALKGRFMIVWGKIHRKDNKLLGRTNCVAGKPYMEWLADRVVEFKMPYELEKPIRDVEFPPSTELIFKTNDELRVLLTRMAKDRDTWKAKFLDAERENDKWKMMHGYLDDERVVWEMSDRARDEEIATLKKRLRNK